MMDSKTKYNLDHVYCHTNESNNYIRANHAGSTTSSNDVMSLLKENKKLKGMLILHLDLIQEQSDQLMAKDKLLVGLKEENLSLKAKNERLEKQLEASAAAAAAAAAVAEKERIDSLEEIKEDVGKYKIQSNEQALADEEEADDGGDNIIGECNGKLISKIILHRINLPGNSPSTTTDMSEGEENGVVIGIVEDSEQSVVLTDDDVIRKVESPSELLLLKDERKEVISSPSSGMSAPSLKVPEIKIDSDESFSCDSTIEREQESSRGPKHPRRSSRRCGLLTTNQMYSTREWEDEDFCEEFIKEEAKALKSDAPMLEIPKWTVHEVHPLYSIEGTEDLSDDTFLKRHAKLEHDEKRRKKWDVQQIREQRRIEKLKRRHCKDEMREEETGITSFYPSSDSIQTICFTSELPVMAFGEGIPRLSAGEFSLPWYPLYDHNSMSQHRDHPYQQPSQCSSFVFLKKRRRQQSSSALQTRRGTKIAVGQSKFAVHSNSDGGRN